jgi:transposase-like protein
MIPNVPVSLDSRGRVRASKEQREVILGEYERSGMSAARFARRSGMKYSTLAGWLQRYRRAGRKRRSAAVRLVEAVVEAPVPASAEAGAAVLVVELPGGARLPISQAAQVGLAADLLRALTKPC